MKLREIVYMILDELKLFSDDATYTEDHIKFLVGKHRALLLQLMLENSKNLISPSNYLTVCLTVAPVELSPSSPFPNNVTSECSLISNFNIVPGENSIILLKSTRKIPTMVQLFLPLISTTNYFISNIVYVTPERMRFVGFNKFMKNIIYCTCLDGYLYMTCNNRHYESLTNIRVSGIFEDFEAAAELNCNNIHPEDSLDIDFPLDPALTPQLIQNVLKELLGAIYRPKDPANNANDDLADIASFIRQSVKPRLTKQLLDDE